MMRRQVTVSRWKVPGVRREGYRPLIHRGVRGSADTLIPLVKVCTTLSPVECFRSVLWFSTHFLLNAPVCFSLFNVLQFSFFENWRLTLISLSLIFFMQF